VAQYWLLTCCVDWAALSQGFSKRAATIQRITFHLPRIMPEPNPTPAITPCTPSQRHVRHVFVYGTLRKGDDNDITRLQPPPQFVGRAQIRGTLYHMGRYPGLVLGGSTWVQGEVYGISPALEQALDDIESAYPEHRDEYFKREVGIDVQTAQGVQHLNCIVYEFNPSYAQGKPVIACGDWVLGR
jgi:gamma-glutamylcyclotransferase (GGCT)/AIG2-like uncharacterized protein YtfP